MKNWLWFLIGLAIISAVWYYGYAPHVPFSAPEQLTHGDDILDFWVH